MNHSAKAIVGQLSTGLNMIYCGRTMFDFGLVQLGGAPKEVSLSSIIFYRPLSTIPLTDPILYYSIRRCTNELTSPVT